MCLQIPGKVVEIKESKKEGRIAIVDFKSGLREEVVIEYSNPIKIGQYVFIQFGKITSILTDEEAREVLSALEGYEKEI